MGLFQKAVETYDAHAALVGEYSENAEPLAPIGHILTKATVEITLSKDGSFLSARAVGKEEPKILLPVTEKSGGRSSGLEPHPLCDYLKYISPANAKANELYVQGLQKWAESAYGHPFLNAILTYVKSGTVLADLEACGILTPSTKDGGEKEFVCWRVIGYDGEEPCCSKNKNLMKAFEHVYLDELSRREQSFCMIEGKKTAIALQHPKGVVSLNGNAKLISANDGAGFTYRGRFLDDAQAAGIGYVASQKAHNALRWLASTQGVREFCGTRMFICWNPQGKKVPQPMRASGRRSENPLVKPSDYREELKKALYGTKEAMHLKATDMAVLASFDAATTGRLAVTYYNEFSLEAFMDRMNLWEQYFCWYNGPFGIQSPHLFMVVDCAFGTERANLLETDSKIKPQHLQKLLNCKVSGGVFPSDILKALVNRASSPQIYSESNWRKIVYVACAAIQKYNYDTHKGGNEMAWELTTANRSFQYGRLLAVMERAEADYYQKSGESRQSNAIKFLSEFCRRPYHVFERVNKQLEQAYLPRITAFQRDRYHRMVGEIFEILKEFPQEDLTKPLEDLYLIGYELQRNAFFAKKETNELNETDEERTEE